MFTKTLKQEEPMNVQTLKEMNVNMREKWKNSSTN